MKKKYGEKTSMLQLGSAMKDLNREVVVVRDKVEAKYGRTPLGPAR